MIFHEIYSAYYLTISKMLSEAVQKPVNIQRIREIAEKYAFAESTISVETAVKEQTWQLILSDGKTPLHNKTDAPISTLQLRWLKAITLDSRIKLFDCDFHLPETIEPLFTPEDYYIFDRYHDGDDYNNKEYILHFRMILKAIKERQALDITIRNKKGHEVLCTVMPDRLEYSEKDDKFRLLTSGSRTASVINLGRIVSCKIHDGEFFVERGRQHFNRTRTLTLELTDERNALERVMLHFSHFEKTAEKLSDKCYRLRILYDQSDETEMLIRVLSFGPMVRVTEPERFIGMIRNRLRRQKRYDLQNNNCCTNG